ncbi:GntG family PLP-dependent aldolase [Actinosynnema pretiosum]|uniref:Threonine aldolase n=1 Tax=Actinosynnema pretiosum TaxID=42197 RepID=A0A290Z9L5_9PSEU|nr:GntG family PLP-dependent aldolase [Actinosynnema pretiosum]ATE55698.1 threonine aldolase [Actinosynnema pretiosum]
MIELRSDTFTLPTPRMREAMASAPLGDDVYGEDPTVRELEELAAHVCGKQAACLMPSGTMANLAAVLAHAGRGEKILVGDESDLHVYEAAGPSVLGGVAVEPVPTRPDGTLALDDLARGFPDDPDDPQFALPALVCLENTHNRCGGKVLPPDYPASVRRFADERGVAVHLDGARVFNASVASGTPVADLAAHADSLQFCLSKGLGAPIGSITAGGAAFITRVRRLRKLLGGGMRQAGVIAAAGIVAIEEAGRLAADHEHARLLAKGLAGIDGVELADPDVPTNMVFFRVTDERFTHRAFVDSAAAKGLALAELGHGRIRAVTHSGVTRADVENAVAVVADVLREGPRS